MRVPPVPFLARAAIVTPLLALSAGCLKLVEWITPEITK